MTDEWLPPDPAARIASGNDLLASTGTSIPVDELCAWVRKAVDGLLLAINTNTYQPLLVWFEPDIVKKSAGVDARNLYVETPGEMLRSEETTSVVLSHISENSAKMHVTIMVSSDRDPGARLFDTQMWTVRLPNKLVAETCSNCGAPVDDDGPKCSYCGAYFPHDNTTLIVKTDIC